MLKLLRIDGWVARHPVLAEELGFALAFFGWYVFDVSDNPYVVVLGLLLVALGITICMPKVQARFNARQARRTETLEQ